MLNVNLERKNNMGLDKLQKLWEEFSEIPIDDKDRIEKPFLHFEAGTYRFDVWHWFDEQCKMDFQKIYVHEDNRIRLQIQFG